VAPTSRIVSDPLHDGHFAAAACVSVRARRAPHEEQNAAPSKIRAKQEGQATVASRARQ
jgi:hypothetical protein